MRVALLLAFLIATPFAIVRTWQCWTGASSAPDAPPPPPAEALAARDATDRAALRTRYPLGYALFAVQGTELHRLDGPAPAPEVRVDWSATELLSTIPTSVILRPPDVVATDRSRVVATPVRLPRIAGFQKSYLRGGGVEGVAEVLDAHPGVFACVLGQRGDAGRGPGR